MREIIYNADHIVSVELQNDGKEANIPFVTYEKQIKFFGITLQKEGFKRNFLSKDDYTPNGKYYYIRNNTIFEKPHFIISFSDGSKEEKYFTSFETCRTEYELIALQIKKKIEIK